MAKGKYFDRGEAVAVTGATVLVVAGVVLPPVMALYALAREPASCVKLPRNDVMLLPDVDGPDVVGSWTADDGSELPKREPKEEKSIVEKFLV
jgi:hypothetical protein